MRRWYFLPAALAVALLTGLVPYLRSGGNAKDDKQAPAKLENFTDKTTVLSTEKGGLNGDTVITLVKYVMDQRAEQAKALVTLQEQKRQLDVQKSFLARKMAELGSGSGRMERDAVVVVD